jgi:CheY-like chemotaxis protein
VHALIIEDEMMIAAAIEFVLRDCGFDSFDVASSSLAAIRAAARRCPNLITADHVRDGAIVIDVGINRVKQPDGTRKTVGDVDFEPVAAKSERRCLTTRS